MRPWDTFSAREADDFDYDGLADALKPDWGLLDHYHWRRDFQKQYGGGLNALSLDQNAELASAVFGEHPDSIKARFPAGSPTLSSSPVATIDAQFDHPPLLGFKAPSFGLQPVPNHFPAEPSDSALAQNNRTAHLPYLASLHQRSTDGPALGALQSLQPNSFGSTPDHVNAANLPHLYSATSPIGFFKPESAPALESGLSLRPDAAEGGAQDSPIWDRDGIRVAAQSRGGPPSYSASPSPARRNSRPNSDERLDPEPPRAPIPPNEIRARLFGPQTWGPLDYWRLRDALAKSAPDHPLVRQQAIHTPDYVPDQRQVDELVRALGNIQGVAIRPRDPELRPVEEAFEWTSAIMFQGRLMLRRDNIIDPKRVGPDGRTNLQRMRDGEAPLDHNGNELHLHHGKQRNDGPLLEVTRAEHGLYWRDLHPNPWGMRSEIDRGAAWSNFKRAYWKHRADDFPEGAIR